MLGPLNVNLEDFDVSVKNGFLPSQPPLQQLADPYYGAWEDIVGNLPVLIRTQTIRAAVDELPLLSTSKLQSEREWQRAYLLLSLLAHAYIWGGKTPSERLPAAVSVPFLIVADRFDLPTTATYAGLNLWNWKTTSPTGSLDLDHLETLHTFTGTQDESWFFLVSVAMEAKGGEVIPVMLKAMDAVRTDSPQVVAESLHKFAKVIGEISVLLERMYEKCAPQVFYHQIRPFLAGSKNMAVAGLPNGVFYEEGDGKGEWRQYSGGSNAQSSLIQLFDLILGVEHSPTRNTKVAAVGPKAKHGFLTEMRRYMPGGHNKFLAHMESIVNIRPYVLNHPAPEVTEAYNHAVNELSAFRDVHIQIVTRYVLNPARQKRQPEEMTTSAGAGLNLAVASSNSDGKKGLQGTGGTELLPFLKQGRDETRATALE
ncbi:putative indoleamine 2,3-dioxygenase family protein [Coleophoma crateriformis]|uniref:Indoleamine 2,3-dioxygenase n=1 Tax=Coleophoma crateriformis TaxID=565419 RepID=A0A3D8QE14_9HELO|nr:putative indoleamine 2,3-dioxygenase family protein [Coleophoma crateriformis]